MVLIVTFEYNFNVQSLANIQFWSFHFVQLSIPNFIHANPVYVAKE